jgi:Uncharacterized protein conserved in bacteria
MRTLVLVLPLLLLAGCASKPDRINNVCAVFDQKDGLFGGWYGAAKSAEREYGVPAPILMATIRVESGFDGSARPPRTKLLGFIPWKRQSSAYGYSQALDGTWDRYRRETGRFAARRGDFADAVRFVGWYHQTSHRTNGIALNDAYNLYLAYYSGHNGYAKGVWRGNAGLQKAAQRAASMASTYAEQMRRCGR